MFGIGSTELLLIFVVGLIVLGPKNLANMAKTLGKAMGEFRRVSTDFQRTINSEIELDDHKERKKTAEQELFGDEKNTDKKAEDKTSEPKKTEEVLSSAEKLQKEEKQASENKADGAKE